MQGGVARSQPSAAWPLTASCSEPAPLSQRTFSNGGCWLPRGACGQFQAGLLLRAQMCFRTGVLQVQTGCSTPSGAVKPKGPHWVFWIIPQLIWHRARAIRLRPRRSCLARGQGPSPSPDPGRSLNPPSGTPTGPALWTRGGAGLPQERETSARPLEAGPAGNGRTPRRKPWGHPDVARLFPGVTKLKDKRKASPRH